MTRYLHFFVNISIQFVFLMLAYYAALGFYQSYFDAALSAVPVYFSLLGMFLTVYFSLMWKDFYAHNVHSYLKITVSIITRNLLTAQLPVFMFILADIIFVNQFRLSPLKALIFFSFAGCTFLGMHGLYYLWLRSLSYHGYFHKKVMVVGQAGRRFHVEKFFQDMGDSKEFCGSLTVAHGVKHAESHSALWAWEDHDATPGKLEYYRSFMDIVYQHHIGELVIFLGPRLSEELLQNITRTCDEYAIGYYIVPDLSSLPQTKHWDNIFSYIPIVNHTTTNRDNLLNISIKRLFDMGTSLLILLLFLPFGLLIGLLIFLSDWGPVFYVSERVGKDGQIIPFFKFRTMHKNAEK
ncbi:MAG: sugar transferase, partial [Spirochaetota bacterium]